MHPSRRPNILFLLPDQWRWDWTGLEAELPLNTPNLAALAAAGMRFTRAITPSPLCAPARAALASGREYDRCGVLGTDDYPIGQPTFYSLLRDQGYEVIGCGKFDLAKRSLSWGLDGQNHLRDWGFSKGCDSEGKWDAVGTGEHAPAGPYMAYLEEQGVRSAFVEDMRRRARSAPFDSWPTPLPDRAYGDNWIALKGLRLMAAASGPWFLQVNFMGPHDPWDVTAAMAKTVQGRHLPVPKESSPEDRDAHLSVRRNYAAMIENIDRWIGAFIFQLRANGLLDSTYIVVASDHGEMLGDRGLWRKSVPYQAAIGVPLLIAGPGVRQGVVSAAPVTTLDLAATFAEIAGASSPLDWDSRSLLPYTKEPDAAAPRGRVRCGLNDWRLVFDGRHKLIRRPSNTELYDVAADPDERANLADSRPDLVELLSSGLGEVPAS